MTNINLKTNFLKFLLYYLINKKSTLLMPILGFALTLGLSFMCLAANNLYQLQMFMIAPIVLSLVNTVVFSNLLAINIFKSIETDGMELIVTSKPVSRHSMVNVKILIFFAFSLLNALLVLLAFVIGLSPVASQYTTYYKYLVGGSFVTSLFGFCFFGLITALICTRSSRRLASTLASTVFVPLFLLGTFSSYFAEPAIKSMAKQLNNNYNDLNVYSFATNKNDDSFYIVDRQPRDIKGGIKPSNESTYSTSPEQKLNTLFNQVKDNAAIAQSLAWLNIPYQMSTMMTQNGTDLINTLQNNKSKFLDNIINYSNNNDLKYSYQLINSQQMSQEQKNIVSLVPTAPLINDDIDYAQQKWPTNEIIYAWEKADTNEKLAQDSFGFSNIENFVGKLKWNIISSLLHSSIYQNEFKNDFKNDFNKQLTVDEFNDKIYQLMNKYLELNQIAKWFDSSVLNHEKQIYLYVVAYYNLFYNFNQSSLYKSVVLNYNTQDNETKPQQYKFKVYMNEYETRNYFVGGYSSFMPILTVLQPENDSDKTNQKVARYQLTKDSNMNLFSHINNVYLIQRKANIVPASAVIPVWVILIVFLTLITIWAQRRKDFR
ncbi:hypothetical protein ACWXVT_00540 [Mycoplasma sp. 1573]